MSETLWQSRESAPRDGTEILIRFPSQGNVVMLANFNITRRFWESKGRPELSTEFQDFYWAPIPPWETVTPRTKGTAR